MGPRLKVLSDRLVKPGIELATPGLQGKRFINYTTANVLQQTVCLVVNPIIVGNFAFLFNCTPRGGGGGGLKTL